MAMPSITPTLWCDHNLEEAADEPGSILSGSFVLDGTRFIGMNA
jgi:hypothetical protein